MDELSDKYLKLNPFVQNSVGENVIWGSTEDDFCDVEAINEPAFRSLLSDIDYVSHDGKTRALFLVGPAGSGKSHLFARLRRKLPNGQFTFVSNPPTGIPHIKRFILKKVIYGMARPVMGPDGPRPYTQLQRMAYSLLQRFLKEKSLNVDQIHERWKKLKPHSCTQKILQLEKHLGKAPELDLTHVSRALARILDREKQHLAADWLAGSQSLSEADLQHLGIPGPLAEDEVSELMKILGHLSFGTGPIVLILDQLDVLVKPDQIHEIESLMIDLNDSSRNWYIIISLVNEKFDLWFPTLSQPFKERFGAVTDNSVRLAVAELSGMSEEQRRGLIAARLASPALVSRRQSDGIDDPFYPLSESAIRELTTSETSTPRMLIQKAQQMYVSAVTGKTRAAKTTLSEFIEQRLADLRAELREEDLAVDTAYIGDRVEELFGLLWSVRTDSALSGTDGPLHRELTNFEGVDRILACGDKSVRVVLYDVQHRAKFPSVLKKIVKAEAGTILIRDGRVRISGKATKEKLDLFQRDKKFFHLSLDQIKTLHALGSLLAKMREGEFDNEDTEPRPTETEIYKCLAGNNDLAGTDLVQAFLMMAGLEDRGQEREQTTRDEEQSPDHPDGLFVEGIAKIMQEQRWMSFERLCVRAAVGGITSDPQYVSQCLNASPMRDSVLIYPKGVNLLEDISIVIWNLEE